ncbi:DUF3159 domain-containing protein [Paramicrobacterium chengjingii]|uniref:DUF3159 domain-containing protein n=1 Tax=Paramicrobacterium chengjingii TaxID=2769067 RepID=UPI00141EB113|nr:DUF3159 domain-containing protein [Microbacterium chengjingii]
MSNSDSRSSEETPSTRDALSSEIGKAAGKSSLSALGSAESLDAKTLIAAMGGVRGILEAILPGLVFLVAYTVSRQLLPAIVAASVIGVIFTIVRLIQRQTLLQAITGLIAIGISAALAAITGNAEDFYLPGFWTNGIYLIALAVSVFARWPLIGVLVGVLTGDGNGWRQDNGLRRFYAGLTWVWATMFALRLFIELPLYFAGSFVALGTIKLVLGIPLYAPLLVVTWLAVTSVRKKRAAAEHDHQT